MVRLEIRNSDGTTELLPGVYADMTDAWDALSAAQARHGEDNVRPIIGTTGLWQAGYRQHPTTKEWLPRDQVVAAVAAKRATKKGE